jgi:hypothetical protein
MKEDSEIQVASEVSAESVKKTVAFDLLKHVAK